MAGISLRQMMKQALSVLLSLPFVTSARVNRLAKHTVILNLFEWVCFETLHPFSEQMCVCVRAESVLALVLAS